METNQIRIQSIVTSCILLLMGFLVNDTLAAQQDPFKVGKREKSKEAEKVENYQLTFQFWKLDITDAEKILLATPKGDQQYQMVLNLKKEGKAKSDRIITTTITGDNGRGSILSADKFPYPEAYGVSEDPASAKAKATILYPEKFAYMNVGFSLEYDCNFLYDNGRFFEVYLSMRINRFVRHEPYGVCTIPIFRQARLDGIKRVGLNRMRLVGSFNLPSANGTIKGEEMNKEITLVFLIIQAEEN